MKTGNVKKGSRNKKQFTITLNIQGLIFMIVMASLTGATVFSLGVIFGKASRNPNEPLAITGMDEKAADQSSELKIPKDLAIFDINDDPQKLETLKKDFATISKKSDLEMSQSSAPPNLPTPKAGNPLAEKAKESKVWPAATREEKGATEIYTVQVFVTKSAEKAKNITRQLKQKSFDAYLSEITIEGKKLYRIRVGRKSKENIKVLEEKLKKVVGGMGMSLKVIKIG